MFTLSRRSVMILVWTSGAQVALHHVLRIVFAGMAVIRFDMHYANVRKYTGPSLNSVWSAMLINNFSTYHMFRRAVFEEKSFLKDQ